MAQPSQEETSQDAKGNLLQQKQRNKDVLTSHDANRHGGEHIGDGIVGSGFNFQQGVGVIFQSQLF